MLFYIRCPGCSRIMSKNLDKFCERMKNIREDPDKTKKEKEIATAKLLDEFGYYMMCCRSKMIGFVPHHEIIVT